MTLTLPSDLSMLSLARTFVETACRSNGLDQQTTQAVVLAVNEAISNIIRHAHRDRPESELQISCKSLPHGLEICLHDEGEPFDFHAAPERDPGELRVGGRGVFLIKALMDEVTSHRRSERGNTLRLLKRWPSENDKMT